MPIIRAEGVSIRYITGDFKDIGLKEYVLRKLTGNYQVKEFWADWDVTFELEKGDMLGIGKVYLAESHFRHYGAHQRENPDQRYRCSAAGIDQRF